MEIVGIDAVAAGIFVKAPSVRLARIAGEGRAKGNEKPHHFGRLFREFARVRATEAPADDADLASVLPMKFAKPVVRSLKDPLAQPEIEPLTPTDGREPARLQKASHKRRACVAGRQSRQHKYGVPVATGRHPPDRTHKESGAMFPECADL